MPRKALPQIVSVAPGEKPLTLQIRWNTGDDTLVDLSGIIDSFRFTRPAPEPRIVPADPRR